MFRLKPPSKDEVFQFISQQHNSTFSYPEVGASAAINLPEGYNIDRNSILLGAGESTWRRAVRATREWQMFNMPWVRLYCPTSSIEVGTNVAVLIHHFGFCSLNPARIVYVIDKDGPVVKYGFAYGTLDEHSERGEERFTVEWNRSDDKVSYNILAFSRPNKALAKMGYPLARMLQKKFAESSKLAMLRSTSAG